MIEGLAACFTGLEDPRETTKLYDRMSDGVSLDEVERVVF